MLNNLLESHHEAQPYQDRAVLVVEHLECSRWNEDHEHHLCDGDMSLKVTEVFDIQFEDASGDGLGDEIVKGLQPLSVLKFIRVEDTSA